jgi:hyaluronan synthase
MVLLFPVAQLKQTSVLFFWYHPILYAYGLVVSLYIVSRLAVAVAYRPPPDNGHTPSVTVIVACKNEEKSIAKTLQCIFRSDYPVEKLHVVAVDDGSTDNTLVEMRRAAHEFPGLQIVSFEKNLGKRHAMAEGARLSSSDVLVYVDSDSFLRRDSIKKIVTVFKDPEIGAVSGHADVHNAQVNFLTKMQEVRYYLAFRILKAAESVFGCVTCCSGCFAAYRRSAVMDVLPRWTRQKFLGVPANFGDDRALTRFILKRYRVVYHSEAMCSTIVPERWSVFFRQQLRWKKSWIRENVYCCAFMWKRHPVMVISFYLSVFIPLISPAIVIFAVILPLFGVGPFGYLYVYGAVLMATLYALVYLARHRNSTWVYGIWFSLFYMAALVWMTYYAALTLRRTHWGTR